MKKRILLIGFILIGLFLGLRAFGAVTYERTPSGYTIQNPVSFDVSFENWEEDTGCLETDNYWGISFWPTEGTYGSECYASTIKSHIFNLNLPISEYWLVEFVCEVEAINCPSESGANAIEGDGEEIIFEVVSPPPTPFLFIEISVNFVTSTLAYVKGTLGSGLSPFIAMIIGLPLAFFCIEWLILNFTFNDKK